ncbi:MAG: ATP-binding cassette domain-containing protein [Propionibacteriaceae bacterium]|jgi:ATPase subunit of ABC transporter with duplicated ATPase domains|nr:ATP-binding cassette domain-containing protein [Propionibacteriaceae bacterium]
MPPSPPIVLNAVTFAWPDGTLALDRLSATFPAGRTGLVGANGAGKSTLLRLIAGELSPSQGSITVAGEVAYLPQTVTLDVGATVADRLGIAAQVAALRAIESGDADPRHFDALADDWDVEVRAAEALRSLDLPAFGLERRVGELSGGEAMLVALAGLIVRRAPVTLWDEPTNNLDRAGRAAVARAAAAWSGTLVVVSHDLDLLEAMDQTAELYGARLTLFGGPYSFYEAELAQRQAAARQAQRTAEAAVRAEKRSRQAAETAIARRAKQGKKERGSLPTILLNERRKHAQESAGQLRVTLDGRVAAAEDKAQAAAELVREDVHLRIDLPDPGVAPGKRIAELIDAAGRRIIIQGPERVALVGANGVGKTTLLERLLGRPVTPGSAVAVAAEFPAGRLWTDRVGYLPQRSDGLDPAGSAVDAVRAVAPEVTVGAIRSQLARLLVRGDAALRPVGTLSGGERFRVALARLILADPPPHLLILDEPTNNLDRPSVTQLTDALTACRGALLVVSHDHRFLDDVGINVTLELTAAGELLSA